MACWHIIYSGAKLVRISPSDSLHSIYSGVLVVPGFLPFSFYFALTLISKVVLVQAAPFQRGQYSKDTDDSENSKGNLHTGQEGGGVGCGQGRPAYEEGN